ncbi:hypothetical protein [Pedobacter antarcticus]|uniref:hypothetical protein n=1 Tax=Pedobacter antarcticus TaxID=34086 RepID=UPI00292E5F48|nr:hypothetical protein [Pedobacter antarcticus]
MDGISVKDDRIIISVKVLREHYGISKGTIDGGVNEYRRMKTYKWENFTDGKNVFVFLDTLPAQTRNKLPESIELRAMLKEQITHNQAESVYKSLKYAQINKFLAHRIYYRDKYGLSAEKARDAAMKHAVWDRLIDIYNENKTGAKGGLKKGMLEILMQAYNRVYNEGYSSVQSMKRAINTYLDRGVCAVCLDGRAFKNLEKPALKYDARHIFLLNAVVSSGKAYKAPKILEMMQDMCKTEGIDCPSLSWIKEHKTQALKNIEIHNNRYGADQTDKVTPYTGIKPAFYADDQYQIDGWDLPFYYIGRDSNDNKRLKKLTMVAVRDAFSKRIVGYSVARSENRLSLLEAIQDAVANTNAMPFEMVSDNHSYNETKEVGFFKEEAEKLGFTWTVDSNPKRKGIAERYFGLLGERFCKDHYGYIGQGIKTRDRDGRSKQELIDKYQRAGMLLTEDAIKLIAIDVVTEFNKTPLANGKKSPNELYYESEKPNRIEIDLYERLKMFTKRTEYKVTRSQINIEIAGVKYEYQLPAHLYGIYDRKTVAVRYDTPELIYLFDKATDKFIIDLEQKEKAAGALANQTLADIEILNRSTGRLKGVKSQARQQNEEIAEKASLLSSTIFETLNARLTPKNVAKLLESEAVTNEAIKRGININRIEEIPVFSEIENPAFRERKRSRKEKSPFASDNHTISIIESD